MNMLQVIRRGAEQAASHALTCPFCGREPPLATQVAGKFLVGCEAEDCAANPQVSAASLDEAWASWNRRA